MPRTLLFQNMDGFLWIHQAAGFGWEMLSLSALLVGVADEHPHLEIVIQPKAVQAQGTPAFSHGRSPNSVLLLRKVSGPIHALAVALSRNSACPFHRRPVMKSPVRMALIVFLTPCLDQPLRIL